MVNSLQPVFNFFLGLWNCLPSSILAFFQWILAVLAVFFIYKVLKGWLA